MRSNVPRVLNRLAVTSLCQQEKLERISWEKVSKMNIRLKKRTKPRGVRHLEEWLRTSMGNADGLAKSYRDPPCITWEIRSVSWNIRDTGLSYGTWRGRLVDVIKLDLPPGHKRETTITARSTTSRRNNSVSISGSSSKEGPRQRRCDVCSENWNVSVSLDSTSDLREWIGLICVRIVKLSVCHMRWDEMRDEHAVIMDNCYNYYYVMGPVWMNDLSICNLLQFIISVLIVC